MFLDIDKLRKERVHANMQLLNATYLPIINNLPVGKMLTLTSVMWEDYKMLQAELGDSQRFRIRSAIL
jgi:hypothetical protein